MNKFILFASAALVIAASSVSSCSKNNDIDPAYDTTYSGSYLDIRMGAVHYRAEEFMTRRNVGVNVDFNTNVNTPSAPIYRISQSDGYKTSNLHNCHINFTETTPGQYKLDSSSLSFIETKKMYYQYPSGNVYITHNDTNYIEGTINGIITRKDQFYVIDTFTGSFKIFK